MAPSPFAAATRWLSSVIPIGGGQTPQGLLTETPVLVTPSILGFKICPAQAWQMAACG